MRNQNLYLAVESERVLESTKTTRDIEKMLTEDHESLLLNHLHVDRDKILSSNQLFRKTFKLDELLFLIEHPRT